jgi:hypothetical protein
MQAILELIASLLQAVGGFFESLGAGFSGGEAQETLTATDSLPFPQPFE